MSSSSPLPPPGEPAVPARHGMSPRARKMFLRLMLTMAAGYAFEGLMLFGFWGAGDIPLGAAAGFSLAFAAGWLVLGAVVGSGLNRRFHDPALFLPQFLFSVVLCSAMLIEMPQISIQPLAIMSVIFVHSFTAPDRRSLLIAWAFTGVAVVAAILVAGGAMRMPSGTPAGRALILLVMIGCLVRCMGFATYVRELQRNVREKKNALMAALARNEELLHRDELTGVANRRHTLQRLAQHAALFERNATPFCIAVLDVDFFKRINDRHGHPVGDQVLAALARVASGRLRAADSFGRHGGEEFTALFAATELAEAAVSLERVRAGVQGHDWSALVPGLAVTVSCGLAQFGRGDTVETLIRRADDALYAAKHAGRNRIVTERQLLRATA